MSTEICRYVFTGTGFIVNIRRSEVTKLSTQKINNATSNKELLSGLKNGLFQINLITKEGKVHSKKILRHEN
ncbi:MAG: hypothetical protein COB98_01305 [Flavobacteriaceae bacterium]|nr:MAG: hypothetical protein COB98_01305 [Flavobacteriaceae bacterium]